MTVTVAAVIVVAGLTSQIPHCESMFAAKTVFFFFRGEGSLIILILLLLHLICKSLQIPKDKTELDSSPKESLRLLEFNVRHMDA